MQTNRLTRAAATLVFASTMLAMATARGESTPDFAKIVKNNRDAIVNIATTKEVEQAPSQLPEGMLEQLPPGHPLRRFFEQFGGEGDTPQPRKHTSLGSGFIISEDGYVLTNAHVVAEASEVVVKLTDHREMEAKVVGTDKRSDVALLKIDAADLPTVETGDSDDLAVGESVLAIGAPFGLEYSATRGIISALGRNLPKDTYTPFIQTDAAVNPGNSGGPLFNRAGEVIGVNAQIFSRTGGYMGLSFAVPINTAMDIAEQLKEHGTVERGFLGVTIQPLTKDLARSFGMDKPVGALVASVIPDGPAGEAGVQEGDVILRFNDTKIEDAADLPPLVGRTDIDESVELTILRGGERMTIEAELGALSDYSDDARASADAGAGADDAAGTALNLSLRDLTEDERSEMGLGERGLLVKDVDPGPAAEGGIRPSDILLQIGDQPLTSVGQLEALIRELPRGEPIAVQIRRGENSRFISLVLPEAD